MNCYSQKIAEPAYSGIEYIQLKSELAKGWNTWNTQSVLSQVLLPEGIAVNLYLKDKTSNKVLEGALIGRRGSDAESIVPLAHSYNGNYTDLIITWSGLKIRVQSCTKNKEIHILLSPLGENPNGVVLVKPEKIWWNREGTVQVSKEQILFDLPSGKFQLYVKGKADQNNESLSDRLAFSAQTDIAITTGANLSMSDIKEKISLAKTVHEAGKSKYKKNEEVYNAMQSALAWDMIYDPNGDRELTTVSRIWNVGRGGFILFCWDTYFAAYMHSLDNKALAYANAIEITNAITKYGFVPNLSASMGITTNDRSQPPVGSFVVREIYKHYHEKWFLQEVFPKLLTWNRWWPQNRDTDGFLCWGSSSAASFLRGFDKVANTRFGGALESGLDNSPMYDDIPFDTSRNQLKLADVGLMSMYIWDCEALADIAKILDKKDLAKELQERANKYRKNLNKLWDEKTGLYLNKRLDTNEFSYRLSPTNFYPLLAKVPTQAQAERMINEHFYNPNEFWGKYILPSIARNDPAFKDNKYWRGRIWAPLNFLVYIGLRNYDLKNAQKAMVDKSRDLFLNQWMANGSVCENYNADTGECSDVKDSDLFYHWGGLLGFISLIEDGYVPNPNISNK
ncbi:MAG: trehalase family glycosidase [Bacteroidales bacterium]|nr:trehalase family glycosidase [Bacteroidales bacterium]